MAGQTSDDLLALFDSAPLNRRYWVTFGLMSGVFLLDFFDFFLIAFVMSVIGPEWHLTYGQGALILYGAGVGAIIGCAGLGLARRPSSAASCQSVTGTLHVRHLRRADRAFADRRLDRRLAVLRFFVGFGLGGRRHPGPDRSSSSRRRRAGAPGSPASSSCSPAPGPFCASFTSAILLHAFGWRGVAMTGFVAIVVGLLVWAFVPELVRWLTAKGRFAEARAEVARPLGRAAAQRAAADRSARRGSRARTSSELFPPTRGCSGRRSSSGAARPRRSYGYYPVGTDDHRPGAARRSRRRPPNISSMSPASGRHRQDPRLVHRARARPRASRRPVRGCVGGLAGSRRIFQRHAGRRVPVVCDPGRRLGVFCRGRLLQPRALYGRAIRRPPRRALVGAGAGGKRHRQDSRPARLGAARRQRQRDRAQGDRRRGVPGFRLPRCDDAGGGARLCFSGSKPMAAPWCWARIRGASDPARRCWGPKPADASPLAPRDPQARAELGEGFDSIGSRSNPV